MALEREEAIAAAEVAERARRRQETQELQQFYREQKSIKQADEAHLENLVAAENDKIWAKKEAQWRREDQARVNLLKDVYQNRADDIGLKKKLKEEANALKAHEKMQNQLQVEAQNEAFAQKAMATSLAKKANQTDILR